MSPDYELPWGELKEGSRPWALRVEETDLQDLLNRLEKIPEKEVKAMRRNGRALFNRVWKSPECMVSALLEVVHGRVRQHYNLKADSHLRGAKVSKRLLESCGLAGVKSKGTEILISMS